MTEKLIEAMNADPDDLIQCTPDEIKQIAQKGFYDGLLMASAVVESLEDKAKLWAIQHTGKELT